MAASPTAPAGLLDKPIRDCPNLLHLAPPLVLADSALGDIVTALSADPGARVVFVGDAEDRLLGWIPERTLDAGLLLLALPGELWRAVGELDTRELLRASRGKTQTARDLMTPARWVGGERLIRDALIAMARHNDQVVAIVDDQQRLLGYMAMFEVLAALTGSGA